MGGTMDDKTHRRRLAAALLAVASTWTLAGGAARAQSVPTFEVAHDAVQNQYLVVYWKNTTEDIYGRLHDAEGAPIGSEITISNNAAGQRLPNVAFDPSTGRFLVVWYDERDTGVSVYGQLVEGDGTLYDQDGDSTPEPDEDNIQIATDAGTPAQAPAVIFDTVDQHFLVVFAGSTDASVVGRRIGPDGAPLAAAFPIASSLENARAPAAAFDAERQRTLVTWTEDRTGASALAGRVVRADDTLVGDGPLTISDADDPIESQVSFDDVSPRFLVVWNDGTATIHGQLVTPANSLDGDAQTLSTPVASQQQPDVVYESRRGRHLAVWTDNRAGGSTGNDIYGVFADPDGAPIDTPAPLVQTALSEFFPALAYNPRCANTGIVYADAEAGASYDMAVIGPCVGVTVDPTAGMVVSEAETQAAFTVVLDSQPTADVTLELSSDDTTEGTVSTSSITFTPSDWDSPRNITITGVDDEATDGDQIFHIVTSSTTSDDPDYDGLVVDDVEVTNQDDGEVPPGPPTLSWVAFETNGVDPDNGGAGTLFTFHVTYTSPADLAPTSHDLKIDFNGDGRYEDDAAAGSTSGSAPPPPPWAAALAAALLLLAAAFCARRRRWAALASVAALSVVSLAALHACSDDDCTGETGGREVFEMHESSTADIDFTDGKDYEVTLPICKKGSLDYVFVFSDGSHNALGTPNNTQTLVVD